MRSLLTALIVAFACSSCASLPKVKAHSIVNHVMFAVSAGCEASDLSTTIYWRGAGKVEERNKYLKEVQDFPLAFTVRKWGLATVSHASAWYWHEKKPSVTTYMLAFNAALKCTLAVNTNNLGRSR